MCVAAIAPNILVSGGSQGEALLWDIGTRKPVFQIDGKTMKRRVVGRDRITYPKRETRIGWNGICGDYEDNNVFYLQRRDGLISKWDVNGNLVETIIAKTFSFCKIQPAIHGNGVYGPTENQSEFGFYDFKQHTTKPTLVFKHPTLNARTSDGACMALSVCPQLSRVASIYEGRVLQHWDIRAIHAPTLSIAVPEGTEPVVSLDASSEEVTLIGDVEGYVWWVNNRDPVETGCRKVMTDPIYSGIGSIRRLGDRVVFGCWNGDVVISAFGDGACTGPLAVGRFHNDAVQDLTVTGPPLGIFCAGSDRIISCWRS